MRRYREMYDAFFEGRGLIPEGRYCEVGFEATDICICPERRSCTKDKVRNCRIAAT